MILRHLRRLARGRRAAARAPRPERPVCLVGDIHGRHDLLRAMLVRIAAEPAAGRARLVILGDMIDRGPASAGVLRELRALHAADPERVICLMGNHERMLLDFLTAPDAHAAWLERGGRATLASFGVEGGIEDPVLAADALRRALPEGLQPWLARLPQFWIGEGIAAVHAAADPRLPMSSQSEDALLWGHPDFGRRRRDGLWVVHGHVAHDAPQVAPGRIGVDTGAWETGVLSAAWLDADGLKFLEARI
ncbi:serine/threonine protein phosphatase 1 [Palleronia aestuarii]|uniref:Serine/threonine protein phosphatase 1 n=1 Tax=Palleronia aestuarii TaxID=568105 RepID=A0A2W7NQD5_9RHOB|nr:metallophosphoesterase [Palleronia aestuarii]PZX13502.1 serine/threonine protein phosphatase 1 [Palleronia aestuarii]